MLERARRRGAGGLRRRGRAVADPRADARAAAARHPDAGLREQDRPHRCARTTPCSPTSPTRLTPGVVAMGDGRPTSARARPRSRVRRRRRRVHAAAGRPARRRTTTRSWPRTSTTRQRSSYRPAARELADADRTGAGPPGVLRLGDHRRRRRRADGRHHRAAAGDRRATPDGPLSGTVFKVERGPAGEKVAFVRMFSGTRADARPGARSATATRRRSPAIQRLRPRVDAVRRASVAGRADREAAGASATSGSATRSARRDRRRRGTTSRRRRWRPSSSPRRPETAGALYAALDAARRAGPADRPAAGRRPRRGVRSRSTARCRRRSSRRRWPTEYGVEVDVPRDDDDLRRAAARLGCRASS